jgi:pimeloyl-ACP methyl ester carboxylesterase
MSYVVQGEEHGPDGALVLLHDIPAGAFAWSEIMPQLADLGRAVYAIDMLGFGQSDYPWPADTSPWGQADALFFLLKQLGLRNSVLVGHGLGGVVAQILATRLWREETASLVLIDTLCYEYAFAPNWPLPEMEKRKDDEAPKHTDLVDLIRELQETLPLGSQRPDAFSKGVNVYLAPWRSELGKEVLFQHIRQLIPSYVNSVSSDLSRLEKPVLIVWGEQDEQVPLKYGQRLHHEIPGSQLVAVPGAGHLVLFDAPEAVARALTDFVKG